MKQLGFEEATRAGISIGIADMMAEEMLERSSASRIASAFITVASMPM